MGSAFILVLAEGHIFWKMMNTDEVTMAVRTASTGAVPGSRAKRLS